MKKFLRFFEINLAASLVVVAMMTFLVISLNNLHPKIIEPVEAVIYSISLFLLVLQFFIWKEHRMLDKDLVSFFTAMLFGAIAMLWLVLDMLVGSSNDLGLHITLGMVIFLSIAVTFLKLLTWSIFAIIKFFRNHRGGAN